MGIFSLEKRHGIIKSTDLIKKKYFYRNITLNQIIVNYTFIFTCKLKSETLCLVSDIDPEIEDGDKIVVYGSPRWNNKFKILAIVNLTKDNDITISKSGFRQALGGLMLFFTTLPIYLMYDSGIVPDNFIAFSSVISILFLISLILLYKPFLINRSLVHMKKEYNLEYRIFYWWLIPLVIIVLIYVVNLIPD